MTQITLEQLVSLCKRRGFLYQGSEIYGGLSGTWDFGPLGVQLKRNLLDSFWQNFVEKRSDIYGLDGAILMNPKTWQASGHADGFVDPLVEDTITKKRYRADHLLEDTGVDTNAMSLEDLDKALKKNNIKSPDGNDLSSVRQFNMMFTTQIGSIDDQSQKIYLRPETAQAIFVNFKNIVDGFRPDLPFGIAQIGKAFRNEISPRDFVFRSREFEQMEIEYFCHLQDWQDVFNSLKDDFYKWFDQIGLDNGRISEHDIPKEDRAHYSQKTVDFEFEFPFGKKELYGLAYRGDYDLSQHQKFSSKNLEYIDKKTQESFLPVCIEPSVGVERLILALLISCYKEDKVNNRTYLAFRENIAPVKYAVSPLVANKSELVSQAKKVFNILKGKYGCVVYDDHSNIGKRYRRQDEIGTPYCLTIDFQTLEDNSVTIRDRDSLKQTRVKITNV